MCSKSDIRIRQATKDDYDAVLTGFREFYWPYEPLSIGYKIKTPSDFEEKLFMSLFEKEYTLLAELDNKEKTLVGFLVNGPISVKLQEDAMVQIEEAKDERILSIMELMDELQSQCDVYEKYKVDECFHLFFLAVSPEMRQKSIGTKLFERAFELAQEKGFTVVNSHCTGVYSQNISVKLGFECVGSVEYKDFQDEQGEAVFRPPLPHTSVKAYVKVLE